MSNVTGFTNTQKIKEEAAQWLLKLDEESSLSEKDADLFKQWIATSEVHRETVIRMAKTWSDMDVLAEVMAPQEASRRSKAAILRAWLLTPVIAIVYLLEQLIKKSAWLLSSGFKNSRAFAVVVVLSIVFAVVWQSNSPVVKPANIYATAVGEHANYLLDDGTTLWINSNSRVAVEYSEKFRRIRLLQGEAYFDVKKDPARPFEVFAGSRLIRAIGTSFSVYRLEDRIEVLVSEGKVELAIVDETLVITPDDHIAHSDSSDDSEKQSQLANSSQAVTVTQKIGELEAGQRMSIPAVNDVAFQNEEHNVVQLDVGEVSRKLSWLDGKLVFAGESLEEVVKEISRHTSIRIDVPDPVLRKMRIGGHFRTGETDALFHVLESGFGIQVKKLNENHVELKAKE